MTMFAALLLCCVCFCIGVLVGKVHQDELPPSPGFIKSVWQGGLCPDNGYAWELISEGLGDEHWCLQSKNHIYKLSAAEYKFVKGAFAKDKEMLSMMERLAKLQAAQKKKEDDDQEAYTYVLSAGKRSTPGKPPSLTRTWKSISCAGQRTRW